MELIRVVNVHKTYHVGEIDVPVLKGVTFSIRRGEMVALMGASGSGKSTLMNILGCLDRPTSGEYWLDGEDVGKLGTDQRALVRTAKLGFVFQSFNLLPRTTATNNVLMPLDYSPKAPTHSVSQRRALGLLDRVGLGERIHHVPSQMSGGQQQRVAIARSLINQPALLLADEPTGNLDSKTSVEILEMFQQLNAAGITVILVTHDPKVASYAHRTIRVVDGLIEEDGPSGSNNGAPAVEVIPPPKFRHDGSRQAQKVRSRELVAAAQHAAVEEPFTLHEESSTAVAVAPEPVAVAEPETAAETAAFTKTVKEHAEAEVSPGLSALVPASVRTAVSALRRNKMRSLLTTVGIIIGVAAVIAIVEISQGSKRALEATMSTMGANNLIVQSGAASSGGITFGSGSEKTLTPDDAASMTDQCSSVAAVAPLVQITGQVIRGNRNWIPMGIYGTTPDYLAVRDWNSMEDGDMFTERDVLGALKVCVIGVTLARELFENESPIGKDLRVQNVTLRVVGVLGRKGANMMGMDQDDILLAPWTTVKYRISGTNAGGSNRGATAAHSTGSTQINSLDQIYPGGTAPYILQSASEAANNPQLVRFTNVDLILVKAASAEGIPDAMAEISSLLREKHRIRKDENDDFHIRDMSEIIKALKSMSTMMGGLLLIVAMISLGVGGVGIMNIMLVSVTERTREIGLRMAVGARGYHILRQFLIEAVVLCLFGGFVGIAFGRSAATLVWYFLRWPIAASWPTIAAAFLISAVVGITFGFYPAWKASRLDPIEALRYE